jgi:hypothetical protein
LGWAAWERPEMVTVSVWDSGRPLGCPHARTLMDGMRGLAATRHIRGLEESPRGRRQAKREVWPHSLRTASDRPLGGHQCRRVQAA